MEIVATPAPKAERKPWLAGVLSVLLPRLGHLYFGRPELGLCWYATIQLLMFAFVLTARSPLLPAVVNLGAMRRMALQLLTDRAKQLFPTERFGQKWHLL